MPTCILCQWIFHGNDFFIVDAIDKGGYTENLPELWEVFYIRRILCHIPRKPVKGAEKSGPRSGGIAGRTDTESNGIVTGYMEGLTSVV
jgi:hypothetical protein